MVTKKPKKIIKTKAEKKPKLTVDGFLKKLAAVKDEFEWYFEDLFNQTSIRGRKNDKTFCPITAVGAHKPQIYSGVMAAYSLGPELGLSYVDTLNIIGAADVFPKRKNRQRIRTKLLKMLKPSNLESYPCKTQPIKLK